MPYEWKISTKKNGGRHFTRVAVPTVKVKAAKPAVKVEVVAEPVVEKAAVAVPTTPKPKAKADG